MPIKRLFKRAHSGVDTVNRAIQGERDRFKARWDTVDKQAQFSRPEVEDAYNAAKAYIIDDGWDLESATDLLYTSYGLPSNDVQEVTMALYESPEVGEALRAMGEFD